MTPDSTDLWTLAVIAGLGGVTLVTRSFFMFFSRPWQLPHWAERGLQYAPIAALAAVITPEVVMSQGELISTWLDARIFGAMVGVLVFWWRSDVLLTIVAGMAVYLPLHIGLGW